MSEEKRDGMTKEELKRLKRKLKKGIVIAFIVILVIVSIRVCNSFVLRSTSIDWSLSEPIARVGPISGSDAYYKASITHDANTIYIRMNWSVFWGRSFNPSSRHWIDKDCNFLIFLAPIDNTDDWQTSGYYIVTGTFKTMLGVELASSAIERNVFDLWYIWSFVGQIFIPVEYSYNLFLNQYMAPDIHGELYMHTYKYGISEWRIPLTLVYPIASRLSSGQSVVIYFLIEESNGDDIYISASGPLLYSGR